MMEEREDAVSDWIEVTTLGDLLLRAADALPDHEALVFPQDRYRYREVAERAVGAARSLAALGVQRGDRVGLLMPNCTDFVFAFFGASLLGAVIVPINTRFGTRELGYVVENADLVTIVTSDIVDEHVDFVERLGETLPGLCDARDPLALELAAAPRLRSVVLLGAKEPPGFVSRRRFEALGREVDPAEVSARRERVRVRDIALMPFTSGTTAQPKGCLITHESLIRVWTTAARQLGIRADDRVWDPLPLFHMSCIGPMVFTFNLGATLISTEHFAPGPGLRQIEDERATWLYSVFPPITMALIRDPDFERRDLSRVRGLLNVAPADTLRLMQDAFAPARQIGGHFGMTECSGAITSNTPDAPLDDQVNTTGRPLPGIEVRVVDPETGQPLGPDRPGELQVRGFGVFEGYHKDDAKTAATFTADGWLRSGDRGTIDERGLVAYTGRIKDMLKVGGENVAPSEIESHLSTHPAIKLVQVVGVPDERLTEVAAAFVELVPGRELSADEVVAFCAGSIASFKVPRHVRFVAADEWPMSATKIQKFRLQERLAAELQTAGATR